METMLAEILAELKIELGVTETADIAILTSKISGAIREIKLARRYRGMSDTFITTDMQNYYSNVKNLASYDYCLVGAEFEKGHSENGINRSYANRSDCFTGVLPIVEFA